MRIIYLIASISLLLAACASSPTQAPADSPPTAPEDTANEDDEHKPTAEDDSQKPSDVSDPAPRSLKDFKTLSAKNQRQYGDIELGGVPIAELDEQVLALHNVVALTAEEASEVRRFEGEAILLPQLRHLDTEAAQKLQHWEGRWLVDLSELAALDAATASELAKWEGRQMTLNGLEALSAESAKSLAT